MKPAERLLELKKIAGDRQRPLADVLPALAEAARLAPDDPEIPYLRGLRLYSGLQEPLRKIQEAWKRHESGIIEPDDGARREYHESLATKAAQIHAEMERAFELALSGYSDWSIAIVVACFKRDLEDLARSLIHRATTEECRGQACRHYQKALFLSFYRHDPEGARCEIDLALSIEKHPATLLWRGRSLAASGNFEAARADFDAVVRLMPEDADAFLQRGRFRHKIGELVFAAEDFEKAFLISPPDPAMQSVPFAAIYHSVDVCIEIAEGLLDGGRPGAAIKAYDQAMKFSETPNCVVAWRRSFAKERAGDLDGAIRDLVIAMKAPHFKSQLGDDRLKALLAARSRRSRGPQP